MKKQLLGVLLIFMILNLILDFIRKWDINYFHNPEATGLALFGQILMFIVPVILLVLFLIHLAKKNYWFIFVMQIITVLGIIAETMAFNFAFLDWRNVDFSTYHLMLRLNFWVTILTAVSFIWTDRNRYSWFTIHGVLLALITSFVSIYVASDASGLYWLFFSISFSPSIVLIGYVVSELRKAPW